VGPTGPAGPGVGIHEISGFIGNSLTTTGTWSFFPGGTILNLSVLGTTTGASLNTGICYRINGQTALTTAQTYSFGVSVGAGMRIPMYEQTVFTGLAAGNYDFGSCYSTTNTNWNSNDYADTIVEIYK
jgi:hypothetical protein